MSDRPSPAPNAAVDAADIVARFAGLPVAVIGDVMLDHFIVGQVERISPEAPVPVVHYTREERRAGGAGNVARNLAALGADVRLAGLVGDDDAARDLVTALHESGISRLELVRDASRPTTRKVRIVTTRNQQVARVDYEDDAELKGQPLEDLLRGLRTVADQARAIILSDYRKGVVTREVIEAAGRAATAAAVPLLVDPKTPLADRYRGATLLTPNHHEAELMTQTTIRSDEDARRAARVLHERTGASILITRGERGMWVLDASGPSFVETSLAATAREVADVTGAGDTVIAVLGLGLGAGAPLTDAARLANRAAGIVVGRFGPATVTAVEIGGRGTFPQK
jgi:D-beta-D-heptose 7-phosphate kinase/D-beta-D-heptose 1-phosphate adenosyltransferase